ncbi:MAG: TonB-dependent receptor [Gammaproteobacteria bacterium]|nr:TonB-dependent receptor [Gammaproteobacteria bacterium]
MGLRHIERPWGIGRMRSGCCLAATLLVPVLGQAQGSSVMIDEIVVTGEVVDRLGIIPDEEVDSIFGSSRSLLETPRSATMISSELLEQYNAQDINDLVRFSPGVYTSSFFGVAGNLDVRGSPGDNYFRGMKRIENPGNFPTPIGASDRVDIVRGPSSPVYGPGKVGGYLNFVPKSARADTGRFMRGTRGSATGTWGSHGKRVAAAEFGGPMTVGDTDAGYYVYGLFEDSSSYYRHNFQDQLILQSTFDFDLTETLNVTVGQQYHNFKGTENAGWNRISQRLIDDGIYLAGSPLVSLDTDGDGFISGQEVLAAGGLFLFHPFGSPVDNPLFHLDPDTVREVEISRKQVLIDDIDRIKSHSFAFFADLEWEASEQITVTNKFFLDYLDRDKRASYGFSQDNQGLSIENKILVQFSQEYDWGSLDASLAPSYRYYRATDRGDFDFEYFDRRDLTLPRGTPGDRILTSLQDPVRTPWTADERSTLHNPGVGLLVDAEFYDRAFIILGWRYDWLDLKSLARHDNDRRDSKTFKAPSWSASLSVDIGGGLRPYVTWAEQSTLITNQTGGVPANLVRDGDALDDSELREVGIKGLLFDGRVYVTAAHYEQKRSSFSAQTLTVLATESKGQELELRWVVNDELSITGAATWQTTKYNPVTDRFIFASPALTGLPPELSYGGTIGSTVGLVGGDAEKRAGVPEFLLSIFANYELRDWDFSLGVTQQDSVDSGVGGAVRLPSATLVTASAGWSRGPWRLQASGTNLLNERYFRGLFPDIFGDSVVFPERPRSFELRATYAFGG